jgi:hypothetical protein
LGNQQPIKWIMMMKRKNSYLGCMADGYTKQTDTIQTDLLRNKGLKGLCQSESTQTDFNGHLPQAGNTQENVIMDIFNQRSRG